MRSLLNYVCGFLLLWGHTAHDNTFDLESYATPAKLPTLEIHSTRMSSSVADYVETSSGNRVSRSSVLCGAARIRLDGRTTVGHGATLRGDLARITLGRLTHIGARTVLRPCHKVVRE